MASLHHLPTIWIVLVLKCSMRGDMALLVCMDREITSLGVKPTFGYVVCMTLWSALVILVLLTDVHWFLRKIPSRGVWLVVPFR